MQQERQSWPDIDGAEVALGDWVEVFCSWTHQPKFDGRAVQIIDIMRGGVGVVFRVRDPALAPGEFFMHADGASYRRVQAPADLN